MARQVRGFLIPFFAILAPGSAVRRPSSRASHGRRPLLRHLRAVVESLALLFDLLLVSHRISLPPMMRSVGTNSQTSPPDRATGIRFAQAVRFCARDRHRPDAARTVVCSARNVLFGG